ncbi:myelin proteolipid protein (PLP or lipophilin) domain-containing protein [Ditylenchus destructor]|nr:myelin proteolipid protein (PLP or lipophilin) domain-containing protein [Ditylenchus destructor]
MLHKKNSLEKGLVSASPTSSNGFHPPRGGGIQRVFDEYHPFSATQPPPKDGCLSRVPYSSLMAFVMCFIGVVLFAIMMVWSFNASVEQVRRALNITDIPWLDKVHILFVITALLMVTVALVLLCIGILSTGSTREEVYKRESARQGGRISCVVAIVLSYFLTILWLGIVAITAVLCCVYYIFGELCASLHAYTENDCLDFNVLRPIVKEISESTLTLCGGNVQQFCAVTNTVLVWYVFGFIGSMIVCLGLVQFIASNAANYAHVNSEQRYSELNEVLMSETGGYPLSRVNSGLSNDFHVDHHPQYNPMPQIHAPIGTMQRRPLPNVALPGYQHTVRMRNDASQGFGGEPFSQPAGVRHNATGGAFSNVRRNSYHNSLNGSSGWINTMY